MMGHWNTQDVGVQMRVLILGSSGLIGRALKDYYLAVDASVYACDLREQWDARSVFQDDEMQYDLVVNAMNTLNPTEKFSLDLDFFQWAEATRQPRVVYLSGSDVYPSEMKRPGFRLRENYVSFEDVTETHCPHVVGELLAERLRAKGSKMHVFRPFTVYSDEEPPDVVEAVGGGDGVMLSSESDCRDFIHVDDVACTIARSVVIHENPQGAINLCSGVATSNAELEGMASDLLGTQASMWWVREYGMSEVWECGDPLYQHLTYIPRISLEVGIGRLLAPDNRARLGF